LRYGPEGPHGFPVEVFPNALYHFHVRNPARLGDRKTKGHFSFYSVGTGSLWVYYRLHELPAKGVGELRHLGYSFDRTAAVWLNGFGGAAG
jgi:hypothetical protein